MTIRILISTIIFFTLVSCDTGREREPTVPSQQVIEYQPALIHTVYFWTKVGTSTEKIASFEKGLEVLSTCPTILKYFWGPPAKTEDRGVIDNSYAYAINVHFASVADEAAYQKEPIHLSFIEDHNDIWEKVTVYDNLIK